VARLVGLWAPVVGFMVAVLFLSDPVSLQTPQLVSDKILHFLAFGLFGVANMRAFHGGFRRPAPAPTLAALLLTAGFGAFDEWRQTFIETRYGSFADWVADVAGGIAAYLGIFFYSLWHRGRNEHER